MNWFGEFFRRLRFRLRGSRFDQDLADEMLLHLDLRAAEKKAAGMDPTAAEAAARRQFGGETQLREISREAWGWTLLDTLKQDIRYAARALVANPGFTATAVLSLALGIGANTAIFSILNALMLRSLPIEDPQKIVQLKFDNHPLFTNPLWEQVRDHQQTFSGTLAYAVDRFDLSEAGESHYAEGIWTSGDFFRVLGVPAMQGRVFTTDDDQRGGSREGAVAVISYNFWKQNFLGDPSVIGKTVRLNRRKFEIVGVTPPWFTGLDVDRRYDVAIPIGCEPLLHTDLSALNERSWWWLSILGRITPGESIPQAQDRMRAIAPEILRATLPRQFTAQAQKDYLKRPFTLHPAGTGFSETWRQYRTALLTLMTIVALVLLIACANIANLLLARAAARQRELSVRMAIGASRWRVIRQLMTESLLLAALGAAAGFLLAIWGSRLLVQFLSITGRRIEIDLSPDLHLLAFTMAVTIPTAILFGLAPALRATRIGVNHVLKEHARGAVRGSTRFNLGKTLMAGQVALSLILLVGAGLFLQTLRNLLSIDPGFSRHNILMVSADVQQMTVPKAQRARIYTEILDRLRALPGIASAASSTLAPMGQQGWNWVVQPEGYSAKSPQDTLVYLNRVSPQYFQTIRTPLLIGRDFSERDDLNAPKVMVIGESAARQFFGSANPIGKTIATANPTRGTSQREIYEVIGVVKDVKYNRIDEKPRRTAYLASGQEKDNPWPTIRFEIRSDGPVEALVPSIRSAIAGVNRDLLLEFRNFETQVNESLLQPRIVALLSSIFGSLALGLAIVGLYGITTYHVAQRKAEVGIRMALGAQRRSVIWLILRDMVLLLAIGMGLGLAASLAAGRLIVSLLYDVRPNDPLQLALAAVTLAAATAIAAYLPARRAARLDPMVALREE